jgi:hypothetical protein
MMEEKQIFYQILGRYVDNILGNFGGMAGLFSQPIKNYLFNFIDPYIDAFYGPNQHINTKAATEFMKSEVNSKIEKFMKEFNDSRGE